MAKVELQDTAKAVRRVVVPSCSLLSLWNVLPPVATWLGHSTVLDGRSPSRARAEAVTILNVDPGGKIPSSARSNPPGRSTTASTLPVEGWMATMSAGLAVAAEEAARDAASWARMSMLVRTGFPGTAGKRAAVAPARPPGLVPPGGTAAERGRGGELRLGGAAGRGHPAQRQPDVPDAEFGRSLPQRAGQPGPRDVDADLLHGRIRAPLPGGQVAGRGLVRAAGGAQQQVTAGGRAQRDDQDGHRDDDGPAPPRPAHAGLIHGSAPSRHESGSLQLTPILGLPCLQDGGLEHPELIAIKLAAVISRDHV